MSELPIPPSQLTEVVDCLRGVLDRNIGERITLRVTQEFPSPHGLGGDGPPERYISASRRMSAKASVLLAYQLGTRSAFEHVA